jgi:preprotein translocase subunit YajC
LERSDRARARLLADGAGCNKFKWWNGVLMLAIWLQAAGGFNMGSLGGLALPVLFFVALYFLMIVPNQKKQKKWQNMLAQLKAGDRVTTNGGIRGTILTVKDDVVVLRVQPDGVKLEFAKQSIAAVTTEEQAA